MTSYDKQLYEAYGYHLNDEPYIPVTQVTHLNESPREIMRVSKLVNANIDEMDRWQLFLRVVYGAGHTPLLVNAATRQKYIIRSASTGSGGTHYGLRVIPVKATRVTDEISITPITLKKGDYHPSIQLTKDPEERKKKIAKVKSLRNLGHDI